MAGWEEKKKGFQHSSWAVRAGWEKVIRSRSHDYII